VRCEEVREQIALLTLGELSFEQEEVLEDHLSGCAACRAERALMEKMESALNSHGEAEIPAGLLAKCRRDLSARIEQERLSPVAGFSWSLWWRRWVVHPPMWLRPVGAVAMVCLGFLGARFVPLGGATSSVETAGFERGTGNVQRVKLVNTEESGRVRVLFDEVRQRELSGDLNDERIRRLLLAAASDPTDPAIRANSISALKQDCSDDEVRKALLHSLQSDPNSGVRLKALDALRPYAHIPETRHVLSQVLLVDDNPGVRTQVIELLTASKSPELAGVLQQLLQREQNNYVRSLSQRALTEMKASQGTF
jgi:hypothetical protein